MTEDVVEEELLELLEELVEPLPWLEPEPLT